MQHTQNYQLSRWEKDDRIMMEDFNADNEKIDAALKANADAVDALQTGKADAAALSEETSARTAADSSFAGQLAALAANLGVHGHNCRIAYGSYVGSGTYGESNPVSLSFDFCPLLVFITSNSTGGYPASPCILMRNINTAHPSSSDRESYRLSVSWSDNGVSWYGSNTAGQQENYNGRTYVYVVVGYDKEAEEA